MHTVKVQRSNNRGFTLIELLVVIAVLAVLAVAAFVILNPAKRVKQARDATRKTNIGQIAMALEAYYTLNRGYPPANPGLSALVTNGDLRQLPQPPDGGTYTYGVLPAGCTNIPPDYCLEAYVYDDLEDPAQSGNVWCWRSATGKAGELAAAGCTP